MECILPPQRERENYVWGVWFLSINIRVIFSGPTMGNYKVSTWQTLWGRLLSPYRFGVQPLYCSFWRELKSRVQGPAVWSCSSRIGITNSRTFFPYVYILRSRAEVFLCLCWDHLIREGRRKPHGTLTQVDPVLFCP